MQAQLPYQNGPSDELKSLNCFWRSKSQSPASGRADPFGFLHCKGKSIVLLTASLFFFFWEDTCLGTQCLFSHFLGQSSQPFSLGKLQTVNINHHNSVRSNLPFTWHREDLSGCTVYQLGGLTTHIASCLVYLHYRREWVILQIFQRGGISLIYWSHGYCTPMYHCLKQLHLKIHI